MTNEITSVYCGTAYGVHSGEREVFMNIDVNVGDFRTKHYVALATIVAPRAYVEGLHRPRVWRLVEDKGSWGVKDVLAEAHTLSQLVDKLRYAEADVTLTFPRW